MKKFATIFLSVILMLSCSICVFADVGPPNINPYYVYAGPNGTKLTYPTFGIDPERHIIAPAGSKIKITHVNKKLKEYCGFYENDFFIVDYSTVIQNGEIVKPDIGKNLGYKVNVKVTPDVGLNLRIGPSSNYETLELIPQGTEVIYEYVFSNNSGDWGYVNYNGKSGWVSLKYIEEIETTTESTTETIMETSSESAVSEPETSTTEISEETSEMKEDAVSVLTETKNRVIIGVAAAVIVCITAIVIIILIKKKKDFSDTE